MQFIIKISLFSLLLLGLAPESKADYQLGDQKLFWVWDLNVMPPGFRQTQATVHAVGPNSYIFVEDALWGGQINNGLLQDIESQLENKTPIGSINSKLGIIPLEQNLFAKLPTTINPDPRLVVLFANLGQYKTSQFDGFFNVYDQMSEQDAEAQAQHSNMENIIYMNGLRQNENYTVGVISHELQHLLASGAGPQPGYERDTWFSEMLAEGAMLLTGYNTDQDHINQYVQNSGQYPLVTDTYVQYGPQILFAAFLLDTVQKGATSLSYLTDLAENGREAVENLFSTQTDTPLNFDAIYSNFLSYVFDASQQGSKLPNSWQHGHNSGIMVPAIPSLGQISSFPSVSENTLYPYSFGTFSLGDELPASAIVKVELEEQSQANCSGTSTLLWKPINPKLIAVYAVGCEPHSSADKLKFRLTILDKPSLFVQSPLKLSF